MRKCILLKSMLADFCVSLTLSLMTMNISAQTEVVLIHRIESFTCSFTEHFDEQSKTASEAGSVMNSRNGTQRRYWDMKGSSISICSRWKWCLQQG